MTQLVTRRPVEVRVPEPVSRDCGSCDVCCTIFRVPPLNKPARESCRHQGSCGSGCGIYDQRPGICRQFACMWLKDTKKLFGNEHRPDRLGLILSTDVARPDGKQIARVHEVWPGAARSCRGREMITYLKQFVPVELIPHPGKAEPAKYTVNTVPLTIGKRAVTSAQTA